MRHIGGQLLKRLAQKKIGRQNIGVLALKAVRRYCDDDSLEGYVKHRVLFIKTEDQALKIRLFREQKQLLGEVNDHLTKMGYEHTIGSLRFR